MGYIRDSMWLVYVLLFAWYVIIIIQSFMAYGTAYRYTKNGGDNGVSLYGWLFVFGLSAIIPGLGYYLWAASKNGNDNIQHDKNDQKIADELKNNDANTVN